MLVRDYSWHEFVGILGSTKIKKKSYHMKTKGKKVMVVMMMISIPNAFSHKHLKKT